MAAFEIIALNESTPQLRAPGAGDTYVANVTFNNPSTVFTGFQFNTISYVNCATGSLLFDFRMDGTSYVKMDKEGDLTVAGAVKGSGGFVLRPHGGQISWLPNLGITTNLGFGPAFASDTILTRDGAANTLALRNAANAQAFRVYNRWTDANNGEWGAMRFNSNVLEIGAFANGTGVVRNVKAVALGVGINVTPGTYGADTFGLSVKGGGAYAALLIDCDQPLIKWKGVYNSGNGAELYQNASGKFILNTNASTPGFAITPTGSVGFGEVVSPTAKVHLPAGTATANTAPLKLTSGTNLTTPENGAVEYNGTNFFATRTGAVREGILTQSAVTTEVVVADTTVTVNINGTTYKLLARA